MAAVFSWKFVVRKEPVPGTKEGRNSEVAHRQNRRTDDRDERTRIGDRHRPKAGAPRRVRRDRPLGFGLLEGLEEGLELVLDLLIEPLNIGLRFF